MEEKITFAFTTSGFKHMNFNSYEKDFTFFIGDKSFKCNKIIAEFISPKVAEIRRCDSSMDEFYISPSENVDPNLFDFILALAKGYSVNIAQKDLKPFSYIFKALANDEFLNVYLSTRGPLNINNAVEMLLLKKEFNLLVSDEVSYISSHFYKIDKNQLKNLSVDDLYSILSKKTLCISNEDALFDFIMEMHGEDENYKQLFELIEFSNLSENKLSQFFYEISFDDINSKIWNSIWSKILNDKPKIKRKYIEMEGNSRITTIPYTASNEMKGIFSNLTLKFHCNVGDIGIVRITASSVYLPQKIYSQNNVVELLSKSSFLSKNEESQWICFDFKDRRVVPSYYSLKSCNGGPDNCHPKSWVIEASEDGYIWKELDRQNNCSAFNESEELFNNVASFPIIRMFKARYLRFKQIDKNTAKSDYLYLQGIEFYGKLYENF